MKGIAVHHIAVGGALRGRQDWLQAVRAKGGQWTGGESLSDDAFAYVDFGPELGLMFESSE
jgi:hypothetical protein